MESSPQHLFLVCAINRSEGRHLKRSRGLLRVLIPVFPLLSTFLRSQAISFLTQIEIEYLAFSAKYITFEQVLRFLMDYIDGDRYYKIKDPEHNLRRTRAQYRLLQSMEEQYSQMVQIIDEIVRELKGSN